MINLAPGVNPKLATDISASEHDSLTAYLDTTGNWTIGRGHLLPKPAPGKTWANFEIVQSTSDDYFNTDLLSAIKYATSLPEYLSCDTSARQNALVELCFNMRGRWVQFVDTRAAIQGQHWQAAHDDLLNSLWASQVQPHRFIGGVCLRCSLPEQPRTYCKKLVGGRADRIANQFLKGDYS